MNTFNQITLSKSSSTQQIKTYFERILQFAQLDEQFPINLEEVWMLVYGEKSKAVRFLKENFIEDLDYQILAQNGKNSKGGRPVTYYYLSVSCLEYFIARKVRPVFDVYREVFHQSVANVQIKNISNRKSESISKESMQRNLRMMYEKLFANLEHLDIRYNPALVNIYAFSWDDSRGVRSNINTFIEAYFKMAIGSARLIQEKTSRERELTAKLSLSTIKYEDSRNILKHKQDIVNALFCLLK